MTVPTADVLAGLLAQAGLPPATGTTPRSGRGFDNEIVVVDLPDGRRVVLRRWSAPRPREHARARLLSDHDLPAPGLLAADDHASLVEFAPGELLGDLIEAGRDTAEAWRLVGVAYRRVHDVTFPTGLAGTVHPDRIELTPVDPVAVLHDQIDGSAPGLRRLLPEYAVHLPALHEAVDAAAGPLRMAPTALGHGDINMWNVLVSPERATLIDWDFPRVADPAMEVALLDKHASLFNGKGMPRAFFDGYGPSPEPNTALHRVIQTLTWAAGPDWADIEADPHLSPDLKQRARTWLPTLVDYLRDLPRHIQRLRTVTDTSR